MNIMYSEREIDILDMFKKVMRRWHIALIAAILGAIIFAGTKYVSNAKAYSVFQGMTDAQVIEYARNYYESQLNELDKNDVRAVVHYEDIAGTISDTDGKAAYYGADIRRTFSDSEKSYYYYIRTKDDAELLNYFHKTVPTSIAPSLNKKYIILGALCGAILVVGFVCVSYVFSDKIHSCEEFEKCIGTKVLCEITAKNAESGNMAGVIVTEVFKSVSGGDKYLLGVTCGTNAIEAVDKLGQLINGIVLYFRKMDSKMIERLAGCEGLILAVKSDESKYKDVQGIVNLCNNINAHILGFVFVE